MWKELKQWEERHDAIAFGVITTQEVYTELKNSVYFNKYAKGDFGKYICRAEDVQYSLILEAMKQGSETTISTNYGGSEYQQIMEYICNYIKETLLAEISSVQNLDDEPKGNFYDDVTKKYYKWNELMKILRLRDINEKKHSFKSYEDWREENASKV